jgi:uncharacterized protein YjiS (DUF1127 family)
MFKRIIRSMIRSQQLRAERKLLESYSDRELNDIGINRADIDRIYSSVKK